MSFRTILITRQSKLNYKNRHLVVKQELDEKWIHVSEIDTIIIDSLQVSISNYLLKELSENKINVILCDENHNPYGEVIPFYNNCNTSKKVKEQVNWNNDNKNKIWAKIVKNKIINQAMLIRKIDEEKYDLLLKYVDNVSVGDKTNREGHAAKVYFNTLFGLNFIRNNDDEINSALNYGYSVLLSTVSKEIVSNGYITQLGIHHKNEYNEFNLSCDLMEPFRVAIDNFVYYNQSREFNKTYKIDLINVFNKTYKYQGKHYTLKDIIKLFVKNTLENINNENNYEDFIFYEG